MRVEIDRSAPTSNSTNGGSATECYTCGRPVDHSTKFNSTAAMAGHFTLVPVMMRELQAAGG
jgi:hypothetical protein